AKTHDFGVRAMIGADSLQSTLGRIVARLEHQGVQEAHSLEEIVAMSLFYQVVDYSRILSPDRGGHLRRTPSRRLVVAVNWVNELIEQYEAKNRSSTAANR